MRNSARTPTIRSAAPTPSVRPWPIAGGTLPAGFPVISIEPSTHIDISKQFYLLPILEASEAYLSNNIKVRMLRVASVTLKKDGDDPLKPKVRQNLYESLKDFKLGVVFVVDTTIRPVSIRSLATSPYLLAISAVWLRSVSDKSASSPRRRFSPSRR